MRRLLSALAARRVVDAGPERRATWLELFFDLVFAAAVAEVAGLMGSQFDWSGFLGFLPPFLLIWWAWVGHTFFSTRFDSDDTVQRLLTVGQMFLVAVMAANAHPEAISREAAGFVASYGGMRVLLALQYLRSAGVDPTGTVARRYAVGVGAAAVLWIGASLIPGPARLWVGGVALIVDLLCPLWASRGERLPLHEAHLPERFGLFTLIVLGEMVAGTMGGMRHQESWSLAAAGAAILGLGLAFALWWFYFDVLKVPETRPNPSSAGADQPLWLAAHLPLCLGVVVAGIGIEHVVESGGAAPLEHGADGLLVGGLLLILVSKSLIVAGRFGPRGLLARAGATVVLLLSAGLLLAAGPRANTHGAVWLLGTLLGSLVVVMLTIGRMVRPPAAAGGLHM